MPLDSPERKRGRKDAATEISQRIADVVERSLESSYTPGEEREIGRQHFVRFEGGEYEITATIKIKRI